MCSFLFGSCDDSILPYIMSSRNSTLRDTDHLSIVSLDPTRAPHRRLKTFQGYNYTLCTVRILGFCSVHCVKSERDHTIELFNRDCGPRYCVIFQALIKLSRPHNEISLRGVVLQSPENHL